MIYTKKEFSKISGMKLTEIDRLIVQGFFIEGTHFTKPKVNSRKIYFDENALTIANLHKEQDVKNLQKEQLPLCRLHDEKWGTYKAVNGLKGYIRKQKVS